MASEQRPENQKAELSSPCFVSSVFLPGGGQSNCAGVCLSREDGAGDGCGWGWGVEGASGTNPPFLLFVQQLNLLSPHQHILLQISVPSHFRFT